MDELTKIADKVELAGNTIDTILDWLSEDGIGGSTIDELVDVMQTCLDSAAELREMAGECR